MTDIKNKIIKIKEWTRRKRLDMLHSEKDKFLFNIFVIKKDKFIVLLNNIIFINFINKIKQNEEKLGTVFVTSNKNLENEIENKYGKKIIFYIEKIEFNKFKEEIKEISEILEKNGWDLIPTYGVPDVWFEDMKIIKFLRDVVMKDKNVIKKIKNKRKTIFDIL